MGLIRNRRDRLLQSRAQGMRRADTRAEAQLWNALRDRRLGGWKWRRQVPLGPFIADFLCVDARLVVELDGGQHTDRTEYDRRRTTYLEGIGFRVQRLWNSSVLTNRDGVCMSILDACGGEAFVGPLALGPSSGARRSHEPALTPPSPQSSLGRGG